METAEKGHNVDYRLTHRLPGTTRSRRSEPALGVPPGAGGQPPANIPSPVGRGNLGGLAMRLRTPVCDRFGMPLSQVVEDDGHQHPRALGAELSPADLGVARQVLAPVDHGVTPGPSCDPKDRKATGFEVRRTCN
jgi:hypothetical protein